MGTSAHGLDVTFTDDATSTATSLTVTNLQVNETADVIDTSDLSMATGTRKTFITGLLDAEVTVDYISTTLLSSGTEGSISIGAAAGAPFTYTGNATITSATLGGAVGDIVKGSATFKVS